MNKCFVGDCRDSMRELIAQGVKVQTVCTSPPYWGLRDYGTASWEGGDAGCDHATTKPMPREDLTGGGCSAWSTRDVTTNKGGDCGKCSARRIDQQLGLESTPDEYVANMVEVFRLVRDLLADDGTCWINLGSSYASGDTQPNQSLRDATKFKPKDMVPIPWMVAMALQADGWYLRQDIIWSKPNPMPESVRDRCTKAHEYLFLLSKRERYFFDQDAIREPHLDAPRVQKEIERQHRKRAEGNDHLKIGDVLVNHSTKWGGDNGINETGRNRRSVWTIATQPYAEAHFATFPRALVEPCILAGSRSGDIVFDPFMGSGTVGQVAQDLGRQWIGCELSEEYVKLQDVRTAQQGIIFA